MEAEINPELADILMVANCESRNQSYGFFEIAPTKKEVMCITFLSIRVRLAPIFDFGFLAEVPEPTTTATNDNNSIIPSGKISGIVKLTLRGATALFPCTSIAVTT